MVNQIFPGKPLLKLDFKVGKFVIFRKGRLYQILVKNIDNTWPLGE